MTHDEIEACKKELAEILQKRRADGKYKPEVQGELHRLADRVGASTQTVFIDIIHGGHRIVRDAEECELAYNIHQALQTASMIDMCRTASQNHEIARAAQQEAAKSLQVSKCSMIAAYIAAAAAWAAVIANAVMTHIMATKP